jgi:hypothetical protein
MILIDPPVNPFSPIADIEAWIAELRAKPASHERDDSITQAEVVGSSQDVGRLMPADLGAGRTECRTSDIRRGTLAGSDVSIVPSGSYPEAVVDVGRGHITLPRNVGRPTFLSARNAQEQHRAVLESRSQSSSCRIAPRQTRR